MAVCIHPKLVDQKEIVAWGKQRIMDHAAKNQINRNKASRRRLRLLAVVFFCFVGWVMLTFWHQLQRVEQKSADMATLEKQLQEVQQQHSQYQQQYNQLNDPGYIEQKARQEYHYVKPGETMFDVPAKNR